MSAFSREHHYLLPPFSALANGIKSSNIGRLLCGVLLSGLVIGGITTPAKGVVIVNAVESAGDVLFTGSGSINLSTLTFDFDNSGKSGFEPVFGTIRLGPEVPTPIDIYDGVTQVPLSSFGSDLSNVFHRASTGSGDVFAALSQYNEIEVPRGYLSGSALNESATFTGETFATLQLNTGTYIWSWGTGGTYDEFVLNIKDVPDTGSSIALLGLGFLGLVGMRRRFAK